MAGHRNFKVLRDQLAEKIGEERLAAREREALERYEAEERRLTATEACRGGDGPTGSTRRRG